MKYLSCQVRVCICFESRPTRSLYLNIQIKEKYTKQCASACLCSVSIAHIASLGPTCITEKQHILTDRRCGKVKVGKPGVLCALGPAQGAC